MLRNSEAIAVPRSDRTQANTCYAPNGFRAVGPDGITPRHRRWAVDPTAQHACLAVVKVRDLLRLLATDGWMLVRTRRSHQQYKHPTKPGLVTVAGSGNDDLAPGTLNSLLKQAGLKSLGQE